MKKYIIIFMVIIVLIVLNVFYDYVLEHPKYNSIHEYAERQLNVERYQFIESNDFYFIFGYTNDNSDLQEQDTVYYNSDGLVEPIDDGKVLKLSPTIRALLIDIKIPNYNVYTITEFQDVYLFSAILQVEAPYIKKSDMVEYLIYDNYGDWEYIETEVDSRGNKYLYYFRAINKINGYQAVISVDNNEYNLINEEEIIFFFDKGTSQTDIDRYYGY